MNSEPNEGWDLRDPFRSARNEDAADGVFHNKFVFLNESVTLTLPPNPPKKIGAERGRGC